MRFTLRPNRKILDQIRFLLRVSSHDLEESENLQKNIFHLCLRATSVLFDNLETYFDEVDDWTSCFFIPLMMLRHPLWRWSSTNINILAQGLRYAPDDCLFKTFSEEPLMVINTDGSYINLSGAKKSERESQGDFLTVLKSISFPDGILNEANELINSIENRLQFRLC